MTRLGQKQCKLWAAVPLKVHAYTDRDGLPLRFTAQECKQQTIVFHYFSPTAVRFEFEFLETHLDRNSPYNTIESNCLAFLGNRVVSQTNSSLEHQAEESRISKKLRISVQFHLMGGV